MATIPKGNDQSTDDKSLVKLEAIGLSEGEYGEKVQRLIGFIDDLRALGAEAVIDLPRIAVIGNQSAGKSSLVEAVSGVRHFENNFVCDIDLTVTCLRSPFQETRTLAQAMLPFVKQKGFEAHVMQMSHGMSLEAFDKTLELSNDTINAREEKFGPLITDNAKLEQMIRRAQLAILNPDLANSHFLEMTDEKVEERVTGNVNSLQFSQDVVCLDIAGPDVTNLSFIDLPGLISNAEEENVTLVEDMVKDYISGNTLILLTISMKEDIQMQKAARLADDADPQGLRTVGVLTKPDTLEEGQEGLWVELLTGRGAHGSKYKLHNGYYVTKQPALAELKDKVEHSVARQREAQFFETTSPWKDLPIGIRKRMGTPNLTLELSRLLSLLIEKSLPGLRKKANLLQIETQSAVNDLPPPLSGNAIVELVKLSTSFSTDVNKCILGTSGHEELTQHCRTAYDTFMTDILSTRPNFYPIQQCEVRDDERPRVIPTIEEAANLPCISEPVFLNEVHDFLDKSLTRELPFNVPFSAKAKLIQDCFTYWHGFAVKCFISIKEKLICCLLQLVEDRYGRYTRGGLGDHVRRIIESEVGRHSENTQGRIQWLLDLENTPYTKNEYYFADYRNRNLEQYREIRREHTAFKHDKSDLFERELIVMSEVAAYFRIAYKRIVDNLPRVIDYDFLRALDASVLGALNNELGIGESDASARAESYLKEEPNVAANREDLTRKKERLREIVEKLDRFYL